jgi:hypothetical protein
LRSKISSRALVQPGRVRRIITQGRKLFASFDLSSLKTDPQVMSEYWIERRQVDEREALCTRADHREAAGVDCNLLRVGRENIRTANICIAPKLITEPKASHIQIIPGISTPEPITFAPGKIFAILGRLFQSKINASVGRARVSYHGRRWYAHIAPAFPMAQHYRAKHPQRHPNPK